MVQSFGEILREWRLKRHLSQLELGLDANVSARHISFVESGRSVPSRAMVLRLTRCLQMPKQQINQALLSAGLAPVYVDFPKDHRELAPVQNAIGILLDNHQPFPALALDRHWNVKNMNVSAQDLLVATGFSDHGNIIEAIIADHPTSSSIQNWHETVNLLLQRLKTELFQSGIDPILTDLITKLECRLAECTGVGAEEEINYSQVVIPTHFKVDSHIISIFSIIAQFGTVLDLSLGDLRVELMFPANSQSEQFFLDRHKEKEIAVPSSM